MRSVVLQIALVLVVSGCQHETIQETTVDRKVAKEPNQANTGNSSDIDRTTSPKSDTKPEETPLQYNIIKQDTYLHYKRSVDIRLSRKVSEDVLRSLAFKIKQLHSKTYDRTFICYYLPGMEVDSGAWATTHFNPDLEVRVLGASLEQEQVFIEQAMSPSKDVIGTWLYNILGAPDFNRTFTIYGQDNKLYLKTMYTDGSGGTELIYEKSHSKGRFFQTKKQAASTSGEYFLIDKQGDLQYCDNEGSFAVAEEIK